MLVGTVKRLTVIVITARKSPVGTDVAFVEISVGGTFGKQKVGQAQSIRHAARVNADFAVDNPRDLIQIADLNAERITDAIF